MEFCTPDSAQNGLPKSIKLFHITYDRELICRLLILYNISLESGQEIFKPKFRAEFKGFSGIIITC